MEDHDALISKLKKEVELAAFLNRGVLSSNQEQKLRISELEAENAVLRTTESKLAALEEAFEEQETKTKRAEHALDESRRHAQKCLRSYLDASRNTARARRDAMRWRIKYERLATAVAQATSLFEDAEVDEPNPERENFSLALPDSTRVQTAHPGLTIASLRTSQISELPRPIARGRKRLRISDEENGLSNTLPPTARKLFSKAGSGMMKEPSLEMETGEEDTPSPRPHDVRATRKRRVPDDDYIPQKGKGTTSTDTPPVTRRSGRHSSPLPRRATVLGERAPATAPRTRRSQLDPETQPDSEMEVTREPESDQPGPETEPDSGMKVKSEPESDSGEYHFGRNGYPVSSRSMVCGIEWSDGAASKGGEDRIRMRWKPVRIDG